MKTTRTALFLAFLLAIATPDLSLAQIFGDPEADVEAETDSFEELVEETPPPPKFRVFLDPGHGGSDLGGKSQKLILEKNLTLHLSQLVRKKLGGKTDKIEVIQSRLDDADIPLIARLEKANQSKVSLYISLHAASSTRLAKRPIALYYYKRKDETTKKKGKESWRQTNEVFSGENIIFARLLSKSLNRAANRKVNQIGTEHLFLGGLSMPAVLVEVIDLANPEDQMKLESGDYLEKIAGAIALAVEQYAQTKESQSGGTAVDR